MIGPITFDAKCAGARSAGNPHAACDVAGAGNGVTDLSIRARRGKPWIQTSECPDGLPRQLSTLPFRRRGCWVQSQNCRVLGFTPAVSRDALKAMRVKIRKSCLRHRTDLSLKDIADWLNPIMRGWLAYYGGFYRSAMYAIIRHVNKTLARWAIRKYKALRRSKTRARLFLERCMKETPGLFVHWREGMKGAFA